MGEKSTTSGKEVKECEKKKEGKKEREPRWGNGKKPAKNRNTSNVGGGNFGVGKEAFQPGEKKRPAYRYGGKKKGVGVVVEQRQVNPPNPSRRWRAERLGGENGGRAQTGKTKKRSATTPQG